MAMMLRLRESLYEKGKRRFVSRCTPPLELEVETAKLNTIELNDNKTKKTTSGEHICTSAIPTRMRLLYAHRRYLKKNEDSPQLPAEGLNYMEPRRSSTKLCHPSRGEVLCRGPSLQLVHQLIPNRCPNAPL